MMFLDLSARPGAPDAVKTADDIIAENNRLRNLVRRLAESLDTAITVLGPYAAKYRVSPPNPEPLHDTLCGVNITELLREARAAIGEGGGHAND